MQTILGSGGAIGTLLAKELDAEPKIQLAPKLIVKLMGITNAIMKEIYEMIYQYDRDYVFDSTKFEKKFNVKATPYINGIHQIVMEDYSDRKNTKA